MNEFEKARFRLFGVLALFVIFICCSVFCIIKIAAKLSSGSDEVIALPVMEEPQIIESAVQKNKENPVYAAAPVHEFSFDDSRALRGLLRSWQKFRRPKCGILADVTNRKILWAYNADKIVPIASMSKMLTVWMAFDAVKRSRGLLKLSDKVKISANSATGREGGFGFLPGDEYTLENLLQAAIIRSANDAAGAIAVYIGDGEKRFVSMMNFQAKKLGMKNTTFVNPHGLPEKNRDNLSTMNDMLQLSVRMLDVPEYMRWAGMKAVKIGEKTIVNTNNLMRKRRYPGVDGLKTGYTRRAGFCLAFSCLRDGRRLVGVVAGFPSAADRENFVTALLDWAL